MGVMDRDWYRRRWQKNVLGIDPDKGDPLSEATRRKRSPRLPKGAEAGNFWQNLYTIACLIMIALWIWIEWKR